MNLINTNLSLSDNIAAVILSSKPNPAVCSAMLMHINMMTASGHKVTIILPKGSDISGLGECEYDFITFSSWFDLKFIFVKNSINKIWVISSLSVVYFSLLHIKLPIFLWMQGDIAAESYMRNNSKIRKLILEQIIKFSLKRVHGIVYVSDAMKEYYEHHYKSTPKNNIIVPCLSEFSGVKHDTRRIPNSFVYIGGLAAWQCFDEILNIYKSIRTESSIFHIITHDVEEAKNKVYIIIGDTKNIEIYSISDRVQIPRILSQFQYGFLIRKDDVVNLVSSPIKFLEYISCGVNVIMTDAVPAYAKIIQKYQIGTIVKVGEPIRLNAYNSKAQYVHDTLFNRNIYIKQYESLLNN